MAARALSTLFGAGLVVVAMIAGWVDVGATVDLLSGRRVTVATALALVALVCSVGVATIAASAVGVMLHRRSNHARPRLTVLVAGALVVLVLGVAHRGSAGYRVCCVTPDTASAAEQHVR